MIKEAIAKVIERNDLSVEESTAVMNEIMEGKATDAQIAAFLTALAMKGETIEEITGCARVMREKATHVRTEHKDVIDTCGTGGDKSGTFNISTAAALVAAGAGVRVAKHGNRSVSSHSGSADVLRTLGVNIEANVETVEKCIDEVGVGFLFAPLLHGAMKYAIGPRREMGVRTIFNILGPLTNPARAERQLLGVFDAALTERIANVLKNLGSRRAFVVHGADGLDEISTTDSTHVAELKDGEVKSYSLDAADFGIDRATHEDLLVGSPEESAQVITDVLDGKAGPARDITVINAAAAIVVSGKADDLKAGLAMAAESIDSGKAKGALEGLVKITCS